MLVYILKNHKQVKYANYGGNQGFRRVYKQVVDVINIIYVELGHGKRRIDLT